MPEIAAFVAQLKSAFGEQEINEAIRRGKAGDTTFYAAESRHPVGTTSPLAQDVWRVTQAIRDRLLRWPCRQVHQSCDGLETVATMRGRQGEL